MKAVPGTRREDVPTEGLAALLEQHDGRGAVDALDIAAELESSGYSDRSARALCGGLGIFEVSQEIFRARVKGDSQKASIARSSLVDLKDAVARGVGILVGLVLVGVLFTASGVSSDSLMVVALTGWINGQTAAALVWARKGQGDDAAAIRLGWWVGIGGGVLAVSVSAYALHWSGESAQSELPMLMAVTQLYIVCISVLAATEYVVRITMWVALGALVIFLVPPMAEFSAYLIIAGLLMWCSWLLWQGRHQPAWRGSDFGVIPPAFIQASLFAGMVVVVLRSNLAGDSTAFVAASVVTAAAADPLLVLARWSLATVVMQRTTFHGFHLRAFLVVLTAAVAALSLGYIAIKGVDVVVGSDQVSLSLVGAYCMAAFLSAALRAFGASWLAAVSATPVSIGLLCGAEGCLAWEIISIGVGLAGACLMLWKVLADPRVCL